MENIEIDPIKEMQHLQAMYIHYKKLYRKFNLVMLFKPKEKLPKQREMNIKRKYRE